MKNFSPYVVYVDESGDHGLQNIDSQYPIFVLAFCVFHKKHYCDIVVPSVEEFKFYHFGHDQVILHEHDIRKEKGDFTLFTNKREKSDFLDELTNIIHKSNFILISTAIDKINLKRVENHHANAYHIALKVCAEQLYSLLIEKGEESTITHIVVESRGKKEDSDLELEFRRVCAGQNKFGSPLPFEIIFTYKKAMSTGLQLADLVARPIGLSIIKPKQDNRTFNVLKEKFYCEGGRKHLGKNYHNFGLTIFPLEKAKSPSNTYRG